MEKKFTFILFLTFHAYFCFAQGNDSWDTGKAETIRKAYITRELNLSPKEAEGFWPLYNNYTKEIKQARQQYANDEVAFEEKVVEIRKKYKSNFQKVLGNDPQRANKLFTADKAYRDKLRQELVHRQQAKRGLQKPQVKRAIPKQAPRVIKRKPPR